NIGRSWFLGMLCVIICSELNIFLGRRYPTMSFPAVVVLLLVYPVCCFCLKIVPNHVFNTFGLQWTFNTGLFGIKDHTP
ncbi:hypothetical protein BJ875DRAFT_341989, partial [Amylocarpus encephaloides]